jgi:glucose-induced degradation protein 8
MSDLNVMIMNYLVRGGYPSAAVSFAREANLALSKESVESITARMEVRNKIHAGDIEGAIHDINRLNPQVLSLLLSMCFFLAGDDYTFVHHAAIMMITKFQSSK